MHDLTLRSITPADYSAICTVEALSTPNLRYVPAVFDRFRTDPRGEFFLAETPTEIVACAKFTVLPDQSGWLETLRVIPAMQGRGIGKQLYQRYFSIAERENIQTMRMYTGLENAVSRGLAEYWGFELEQTFAGFSLREFHADDSASVFKPILEPRTCIELLMPHANAWHNFLVMNRTFYTFLPATIAHFAVQGFVYGDDADNLVILGARFSPELALHLAFFHGDSTAIIQFVRQQAAASTQRVDCFVPTEAQECQQTLEQWQFQQHSSPYIVMKFSKQ